jgi:hypothetical protein
MIVSRWTIAVTGIHRDKIARGEINPNTATAAYLGDKVSGEFFPTTKPPPLMVARPLLSAFVDCSGASSLNRNCKAANLQQEEEKEVIYWLCY